MKPSEHIDKAFQLVNTLSVSGSAVPVMCQVMDKLKQAYVEARELEAAYEDLKNEPAEVEVTAE